MLLVPLFMAMAARPQRPDVPLFDFESGTFAGWTVEGRGTFGEAPVDATAMAAEMRADRRFGGWRGRYLVMVGDSRHGKTEPGRLVSRPFRLERDWVRFALAAEVHRRVHVSLWVGERRVRIAYGNNAYDLRPRGFDVRDLAGREARLVIEDTADVASLVRVDDFRLSDRAPPPLDGFDAREQESSLVRYGELRPVYDPGPGRYVAHHTMARGPDGRWHVFAAIAATADLHHPARHRTIVHLAADRLGDPFTLQPGELTADAAAGERFLWDPEVVVHDGTYHLFYVGSGTPWAGWDPASRWREKVWGHSTQGPYAIHLATSRDGQRWTRRGPLFSDAPFAFTPHVARVGGRWVMYYAGAEPAHIDGKHAIVARTSDDLARWSARRVVLVDGSDTTPWPEHSFFHSPVLLSRGGEWWLFAGPIDNLNQSRFHYLHLFRSRDPLRFEHARMEKGLFLEGGARMVQERDGQWYVTHAGPYAGGLWIAPLRWNQDGGA